MNVLAIGAHPDDIEFGCGGMLTKYAERGHAVYLYVASDGSLGGDGAVRRSEQQDSALIIGAREVFWGDYQDTEIPLNRELIVRLLQAGGAASIVLAALYFMRPALMIGDGIFVSAVLNCARTAPSGRRMRTS